MIGAVPGAAPILGHAVPFLRDPLDFLLTARNAGGLVTVRLGPRRVLLVCAPDLVRQVLLNPRVFDKGGTVYEAFRATVGNGVGSCPFEPHRRKRQLVQPAFTRARIEAYAAMIGAEVDAMTSAWRPGQVLRADVELHRLTTTATLRVLFGDRATDEVVAEVHAWLPALLRGVHRRAVLPLAPLHELPTPVNRRHREATRRVRALVAALTGTNMSTQDGGVAAMLGAAGLAGGELLDEVLGLLVGGVETVSAALCWTFVALDANGDVLDRLHDEVDTVLRGRPAGHADLPLLEHTRGVVTEALRLYPPVWLLTRQVTEDTALGGHPVPAGSTVMFSPYVLHRDPCLFASPDRFDPDRWRPDRVGLVPQGAWIPFGAGNRRCVGDVLATVEAVLAVATIAHRWRLALAGPPPAPAPKGALSTGPLRVVLTAR